MTLNKTAIEWCGMTWNPVTGCNHGCKYCYARKIAERFKGSKAWPQGFEPMLHPERLEDPSKMKRPQTIFVCSMADLFGEWVPLEWIQRVFIACQQAPQHTYIFLTKNPVRYTKIDIRHFTKNMWFGTTVTGPNDVDRILELQKMFGENTFISFEPLLGDLGPLGLTGIKQVIIGAQTNPDIRPEYDAVLNICEAADRVSAKVFMKDSMVKWFPDRELRRELCWSVNK